MKKIIKKDNRYFIDNWWLKSYHLFSFSEYYDINNMNFWNLRVFNDDFIEWKKWFWMHPHSNMEILTIMLDWEITHSDSMWNKWVIKTWEIQTMTAWKWIFHSEFNESDKDLHLFQIWFETNKIWLEPCYNNHNTVLKDSKLNIIAWWNKHDWIWFLNTDVNVYRWKYNLWEKLDFDLLKGRWVFIYVIDWVIKLWDKNIGKWDQLRCTDISLLNFKISANNTDFILIDVKL